MPTRHDGKVVVFAPYGRDSESISALLKQQGLVTETVGSLEALSESLGDEVGAVLMSEEALAQPNWKPLVRAARAQPSWSAYPFILMISPRRSYGQAAAVYSVLPAEITNVMVLERPMGSATLLSAVRWALAGRRRQFVTRDHLEELQRKQDQQRLMTRELAHRVKNTIAVLQSIVTQTMRPHPDMAEVRDQILERFSALSRAHDLLLGTDFVSADFRSLIEQALSVNEGDFRLLGPKLSLSPQSSLSFALVIHELATNSMKYGALKAGGAVVIEWSVEPGPPESLLFGWHESGGPPAKAPTSVGFGTRLVRSTLNGLGDVEMTYAASGFGLTFKGPLSDLTHAVVPASMDG